MHTPLGFQPAQKTPIDLVWRPCSPCYQGGHEEAFWVLTRKRLCNSKKDLCTQPYFHWSYPAGAAKSKKSWQAVSSLCEALNALPVWLWRLTLVKLMISARQMALVNSGLIRAHWTWDFSSWCLKMEREWTFGPSSDDRISGLLPLFLLSSLKLILCGLRCLFFFLSSCEDEIYFWLFLMSIDLLMVWSISVEMTCLMGKFFAWVIIMNHVLDGDW